MVPLHRRWLEAAAPNRPLGGIALERKQGRMPHRLTVWLGAGILTLSVGAVADDNGARSTATTSSESTPWVTSRESLAAQ
jgi:hypothetical protein